jgi:hypothetical protein
MRSPGHHIRIRLESDRLLHSSDEQRRFLARSVHRTSSPWDLLGFGCAGTHLHVSAKVDRVGAGELARRLEISLQLKNAYGSPFLRVHRLELRDQSHLYNAVLYDMRQREHHQLASDPFLEATSAPDLLGARVIGGYLLPRVAEHLPELRRQRLLDLYGIDDLRPAEGWEDPREVTEASLAAFALPSLRGHSKDVTRARMVVVTLLGKTVSASELAACFGCSSRTVERLRSAGPAPAEHCKAVLLQIDLRRRVRARQQETLVP